MKGENDGAETGSLSKGGQQEKDEGSEKEHEERERGGGSMGKRERKVVIFNLS